MDYAGIKIIVTQDEQTLVEAKRFGTLLARFDNSAMYFFDGDIYIVAEDFSKLAWPTRKDLWDEDARINPAFKFSEMYLQVPVVEEIEDE